MADRILNLGFAIPPDSLADGLYWIDRPNVGITAGFVIKDGVVTTCAPILRKKLSYWFQVAVRIGDA